jgi:predicted dehydrogenase
MNAARFLSGEEPVEVIGHTYTSPDDPRFREVEESVHFMLRFPSGFNATCMASYSSHNSKFLRLPGSDAWAEMDPAYAYSGIRLRSGRLQEGTEVITQFDIDSGDQFAKEMDHMAQCVRRNIVPHTPGEEGMQDMRIVQAIYQSARDGRPVKLAPPGNTRGPEPEDKK